MNVYAMVKMGGREGKKSCEDSLLFKMRSVSKSTGSLIWGGSFSLAIPETGAYLAAVSDGVGGRPAGDVASQFVLNSLAQTDFTDKPDAPLVKSAVQSINERLIRLSQEHTGYREMGATLSGVVTGPDYAWLFHTGNSRVYITNGQFLRQLTTDHNKSQGQPWQKRSSAILSCMGCGKPENLKMLNVTDVRSLLPKTGGGKLIFTTDGVHDYMDDSDLRDLRARSDSDASFCRAAMEAATRNGSDDDMSIMILTP